jgi:hypothetical protein
LAYFVFFPVLANKNLATLPPSGAFFHLFNVAVAVGTWTFKTDKNGHFLESQHFGK